MLKCYLDANALFKFYQDEKGSLYIKRVVSTSHAMVSSLTLLEFFSVVMKAKRMRTIKTKHIRKIVQKIRKDVSTIPNRKRFTLIDMPNSTYKTAKRLLLTCGSTASLHTNDAVHISILINTDPSALLVTSDTAMHSVCSKSSIKFYDPESIA